jgi:hypothetical protein
MTQKPQNFALIIGAMKCGTSSLYNYLIQHPEIAPCKHKEPGFFSHQHRFVKGYKYYQNLWDWNFQKHQICLEASTHYTALCPKTLKFTNYRVAENIAQYQAATNSAFKFIYIMRNPLERIESHYNHIKAQPDGDNLLQSFPENGKDYMIDTSRYAYQIEAFYQKFGSDKILLLNFEELKYNTFNLVRKVCQFLQVDPDYKFKELDIKHNQHAEKKKIIIPGYYLLRETELIHFLLPIIPRVVTNLFSNFFGCKINQEYFQLSAQEKNDILKELQKDLSQINLKYGFDTSCWNLKIETKKR